MFWKERWEDPTEAMHSALKRYVDRVWTAMPVHVTADSDGHTVQIQPTVQGEKTAPDGTVSHVDMPSWGTVPVQFASGGGFTITHPVKQGDEGLIVCAARCIDGWWDKGGVQPPLEHRRHNLSDAIYIPGIRSNPRKLGGSGSARTGKPASTTSLQIRSDDGEYFIELAADGAVAITAKILTITASQKVVIASPLVAITGEVEVGGNVTGISGSASSVSLKDHVHLNSSGPDDGGPPKPGT